jgi:hypothetical protein
MRCVIELLYVQSILLKLYYCALVIIYITIVRGAKYGDYSRKLLSAVPLVHFISVELCLVSS